MLEAYMSSIHFVEDTNTDTIKHLFIKSNRQHHIINMSALLSYFPRIKPNVKAYKEYAIIGEPRYKWDTSIAFDSTLLAGSHDTCSHKWMDMLKLLCLVAYNHYVDFTLNEISYLTGLNFTEINLGISTINQIEAGLLKMSC